MTTVLRIELIIFALLAIALVVHIVNKGILQLKYSLIWLFVSLALIVTACFPTVVFKLTALVGIETPSNLIFFLAIVALLGICFSLTIIVSKQEMKIKRLIQQLSIDQHEIKESKGENHGESEKKD